jgi:hypothetical protein
MSIAAQKRLNGSNSRRWSGRVKDSEPEGGLTGIRGNCSENSCGAPRWDSERALGGARSNIWWSHQRSRLLGQALACHWLHRTSESLNMTSDLAVSPSQQHHRHGLSVDSVHLVPTGSEESSSPKCLAYTPYLQRGKSVQPDRRHITALPRFPCAVSISPGLEAPVCIQKEHSQSTNNAPCPPRARDFSRPLRGNTRTRNAEPTHQRLRRAPGHIYITSSFAPASQDCRER